MATCGIIFAGKQIPSANYIIGGVIKRALHAGHIVYGIKKGVLGLNDKENYEKFSIKKTREIQDIPGIYLGTCEELDIINDEAINNLNYFGIDTMFVLGDEHTAKWAYEFTNICKFIKIIFIPCSIYGMDWTASFGYLDAIEACVNKIKFACLNSWSYWDKECLGPRISIVEIPCTSGRNDIAVECLKQIVSTGHIYNYELSDFEMRLIMNGYRWSAKELLESIVTSKPTLIIVSEGSNPIETNWKKVSGETVGKQLANIINMSTFRKANVEYVGVEAQTCESQNKIFIDFILEQFPFEDIDKTNQSMALMLYGDTADVFHINSLELLITMLESKKPVRLDTSSVKEYIEF